MDLEGSRRAPQPREQFPLHAAAVGIYPLGGVLPGKAEADLLSAFHPQPVFLSGCG